MQKNMFKIGLFVSNTMFVKVTKYLNIHICIPLIGYVGFIWHSTATASSSSE